MRNATEVRRELELLFRTRCPAVGLATWEETRALKLVRDVARLLSPSRDLYTWSAGRGMRLDGQPVPGLPPSCTLTEALAAVLEHKGPSIFAFLDADLEDPEVARAVRDLIAATGTQPRSLLFVSPEFRVHSTLTRAIHVISVPPPEKAELMNILKTVAHRCSSLVGVEIQLEGDAPERLAEAARGLTADEAERAYIRALLQVQRLSVREVGVVLAEKRRLIEMDPLLTYLTPSDSLDDLGGLAVLRAWLKRPSRIFSRNAEEASVPPPRGVMLVGLPGCGRSHAIRAAAAHWELPLVRLEVNLLLDPDEASSGALMRTLSRLQTLAPCVLWIPKLDRLFEPGSDTDGGYAATAVAATLQAWLVERPPGVIVAATAEEHERLPLELLWKNAFDEVFFIDFPDSDERRQIIQRLLRRMDLFSEDLNLEMLIAASEGFSGAQIEQAIARGARDAFDQGRAFKMVDILQSLRQMTPMAGFMGESRRRLRGWAHRRAVSASPVKET